MIGSAEKFDSTISDPSSVREYECTKLDHIFWGAWQAQTEKAWRIIKFHVYCVQSPVSVSFGYNSLIDPSG